MTARILYLSGRITGEPDLGVAQFNEHQRALERQGYIVLNPTSIEGDLNNSWEWWMKRALSMMMEAQGVAMLPNWNLSRGAQIEYGLAQHLGMTPAPVATWLMQAERAA